MAFYDLSKAERADLVSVIQRDIQEELSVGEYIKTRAYYADDDTYIRKAAYLGTGRIYMNDPAIRTSLIAMLGAQSSDPDYKVRQTVINAAGEIGKKYFEAVRHFFDDGLFDPHHSPRNAVIGSVKKMGEVNPGPVMVWAMEHLHHENKEIRREICHGIELRGRKHPEDILPLLKELQHDKTARVRNTLVHVIGQISYKKGCLDKVIGHLKSWENKQLVHDALAEIIDVHHRYRSFSALSQAEVIACIDIQFPTRKS